jgi:HTH-type transcriptional regulator/antitoxin HigA
MITNERQYRISKAQLARIHKAIEDFALDKTAARIGSPLLAKAEFKALKSEEEVLSEQIREYERLKSGSASVLKAKDLQELPHILVSARIAQGLSQKQLAEKLGIKEQQVQRYESEEYASASLRRLAQIADALNLDIKGIAEFKPKEDLRKPAQMGPKLDWSLFPVKDMYKRGWFKEIGFMGSTTAAIGNGADLVRAYVQKAMPRYQTAFLRHRARIGSEMDQYALWAWQCRITLLAQNEKFSSAYSRDSIDNEWLKHLAEESRFSDGPLRAKNFLRESGIPLVIEPHLPQTYLDGATFFLTDERPVIGMTLRYDRLDNFWFVLFHELIHILKHLRKGKIEQIFDDLDSEPDDLEKEADLLAGAALIPEHDWEIALARYVRTDESIKAFADEHLIHKAIVAGRIRKEADNYVILNDLIGVGEVRKQFSEVRFAQ